MITRLLNHPNRFLIHFDREAASYVVSDPTPQRYPGLLPSIQKVTDYYKCTRRRGAMRIEDVDERRPICLREGTTGSTQAVRPDGLRMSGFTHGTRVHRQIELFVKVYEEHQHSPLPDGTVKTFIRRAGGPNHVDSCVFSLMKLCAQKRWRPLASEYAVWDKEMHVATAADLILADEVTRELILIEVKTGYQGAMKGDDAKFSLMLPPQVDLPPIALTTCAQHMMQLTVTRGMLERWGIHISQSYLIYLRHSEAGVLTIVPIHENMEKCLPTLEWLITVRKDFRR